MEMREVADHAAPAGNHQALVGGVPSQKIVRLLEGRDGERNIWFWLAQFMPSSSQSQT